LDGFIRLLSLSINFYKKGLGYILGEFFTNSSGHPASEQPGHGCGYFLSFFTETNDFFSHPLVSSETAEENNKNEESPFFSL
jgi:hypothetical protein